MADDTTSISAITITITTTLPVEAKPAWSGWCGLVWSGLEKSTASRRAPVSKGTIQLLMLLFFGYPEDLSTSRETLPSHPAAPRLANPPSQSPDRRLETKLLPSLAKLGSATQPNYTVSAVYLPTLLPRHPPSICQPRLFFPSSISSHPISKQQTAQTDETRCCRINLVLTPTPAACPVQPSPSNPPSIPICSLSLCVVSPPYTYTSLLRPLYPSLTLSFVLIHYLIPLLPLPAAYENSQAKYEDAALASTGAGCIPPLRCTSIFICTIMLVALGQAPDYYKGLERLRLD
ncbi:hypothetical protein CSUB01_08983 [Colletotrichum sublineola]|uniref:Uncharacterized protein n=1 Tax=Colletotrichum sublineola TaxID=1173701 RepID=A0A066XK73_COLSU|nr:hypothetical protein CSUB01_08983 [Colletotrichum sublineola]